MLRSVEAPIYLLILLVAAALVWRRKRIRTALVDCGRNVGRIREDTMQSTFEAVAYLEVTTTEYAGRRFTLRSGREYVIDDGRRGAIVSRYRGGMPMLTVVLPHVICIMLSMILGMRAALEALRRTGRPVPLMWATLVTLLLGGFVFGPIMQKHAFGVYWAGVPMGWDLTDNKVTIELVLWLIAVKFNVGRYRGGVWSKRTIVIAGLATFAVYMIPHSLLGSGYDYVAGGSVIE